MISPRVEGEATAMPMTRSIPRSIGLVAVRWRSQLAQLVRSCSTRMLLWFNECSSSVTSRPASATCCGSDTAVSFFLKIALF